MKKVLGAVALLMGGTGIASAEGELFLYNWGNYTSPDMIKKFEEKYDVKVTITDFDSNDTALAKIEAGGSGFDLVVPSAGFVGIYAEKGLIQKLDLSRLRLVCDLRTDMALPDDAVAMMLSLIDQVHGLRRELRSLARAVEAQPDHIRRAVIAAHRDREPAEG